MIELKDYLNPVFNSPTLAQAREMPLKDRAAIVQKHSLHLIKEIMELNDELKSDFWKKGSELDYDKITEEFADCLHVLLSFAVILGMDAEMIYMSYLKKYYKNMTRKDWKRGEES